MKRCAVYCGWLADGSPGYIGISTRPDLRWEQHRAKLWGHLIVGWEVVAWYSSVGEAKAMESRLIAEWRPQFNIAENPGWVHPLAYEENARSGGAAVRTRARRSSSGWAAFGEMLGRLVRKFL
jgi:hypothetical protein